MLLINLIALNKSITLCETHKDFLHVIQVNKQNTL